MGRPAGWMKQLTGRGRCTLLGHLDLAKKQDRLMRAMDAVNDRFGKGTLTVASKGVYRASEPPTPWQMKQNRRSPRYTTRWDELIVVGC